MSDAPINHVPLNRAIADFALLTYENQETFNHRTGAGAFQLDLMTSQLELGGQVFRIAFLGTWSEITRTWMWGWANPSRQETDPVVVPVVKGLRDRARELGLHELEVPTFPTEDINDLDWHPAMGLVTVATSLLGGQAFHAASYHGGCAFVAVLDAPPAQADPVKFMRFSAMAWEAAAMSPTAGQDGVRHRHAVDTYARWRGLRAEHAESAMRMHYPHGSLAEITFDELGRAVNTEVSMQPGDVPEPLPFTPPEE